MNVGIELSSWKVLSCKMTGSPQKFDIPALYSDSPELFVARFSTLVIGVFVPCQ